MLKLKPEIVDLLTPMIVSEKENTYFYLAARTWAKTVGYCGAVRQFKCFSQYHAKSLHSLMNIFTKWDTTPDFGNITAPDVTFTSLPETLETALAYETDSYEDWEKIVQEVMPLSPAVFERVNKIFTRETKWWLEMNEYAEKLKLFDVDNKLDIIYFDRKILSWPSR
jgi:hypothetical protein